MVVPLRLSGVPQAPLPRCPHRLLLVPSSLSAPPTLAGFFLSSGGDSALGGQSTPVPIQMCLEESCLVFATKVSHTVCPKSTRVQKASGHVSNMWHTTSEA